MAEHLSPEELRRFAEEDIGPDYLDAGPGYATLMASAGFEDARMEDLTSEYEATTEAWIRERDAEEVELQDLIGADAFRIGRQPSSGP